MAPTSSTAPTATAAKAPCRRNGNPSAGQGNDGDPQQHRAKQADQHPGKVHVRGNITDDEAGIRGDWLA